MTALLSGRSDLVYRAGRQTRGLELGIHRLLCHLPVSPRIDATYCPSDRGVIYRQTFSYGWQVHRLPPPAAGPGARAPRQPGGGGPPPPHPSPPPTTEQPWPPVCLPPLRPRSPRRPARDVA